MRVIAGERKGKRLSAPEGTDTRPTGDKVKEALFSIIQFDLDGARVLDLFAGSGQIGIEALSRGAKTAVFVDSGRKACECIRENVASAGYADRAEIVMKQASDFLLTPNEKFDIIFMDPPYRKNMIEPIFDSVARAASENAVIICEIAAGEEINRQVGSFCLARRYRYGKTELAVFRKHAGESEIY